VAVIPRRTGSHRRRQVPSEPPRPATGGFSDPTWKESGLHSGLLKAYLALGGRQSAALVDKTSLSDVDKGGAPHLVTEILIDAVAPTNAIASPIRRPVRKFVDTGGQKPVAGAEELFR